MRCERPGPLAFRPLLRPLPGKDAARLQIGVDMPDALGAEHPTVFSVNPVCQSSQQPRGEARRPSRFLHVCAVVGRGAHLQVLLGHPVAIRVRQDETQICLIAVSHGLQCATIWKANPQLQPIRGDHAPREDFLGTSGRSSLEGASV